MTLPDDVSRWPPEWKFLYDERAGIKEFQGNIPRAQAEEDAEDEIRKIASDVHWSGWGRK